ncbi:MAG: hypothetical protein DRQ55_14600 [Planctomycetota bacterium]|nr:MAG: hypothetical protein DRQ55_14600 [Planctomycetota bacterium]
MTHCLSPRCLLLLSLAALAPAAEAQAHEPPPKPSALVSSPALAPHPMRPRAPGDSLSARQIDALIDEFLALPWWSRDGLLARDKLAAQLDELPPLTAREAKSWRKKLLDRAQKLDAKLPKKSGRHFLWEDDDRGMFIVGGKLKKPKGLLIGMHGGGVGAGDAWASHSKLNNAAEKMGWLAIFPQVLELTELGWTDSGTEEFVLQLIDRARRTWKIDPNKVFLSGHSMGGYGSWVLGAHHADVMAALAPAAGAPTPYMNASGEVFDIGSGVVPSLRNVPMVIYQSADDPKVPPDANRVAVAKLEAARERWGGYDFEYWEVEHRGHDVPPGGMKALLEKIKKREREPLPERLVWQPALNWKRHFYWLWWDSPKHDAILQADLDKDANTIHIRCDRPVTGLHVLLNEELVDLDAELVVLLGDERKEVWRGIPERRLSTLLRTAARNDPELVFEAMVPVVAR